jgi:DNA-binding transcriptional ArsR family regulator
MPKKEDLDLTLDQIFNLQAEFCIIFRNAVRQKIIWYLGRDEKSVGEIADFLGISISNISQHLRIMKDRRIVTSRREGQRIYYRLTHENFIQGPRLVREGIIDIYGLDSRRIKKALARRDSLH